MVHILEGNSFSSQLGKALAGGLERGSARGRDFAQQMMTEQSKLQNRLAMVEQIKNKRRQPTLLDTENHTDLSQQQQNIYPQEIHRSRADDLLEEAEELAMVGEHDLSRAALDKAKIEEKREVEKHTRHYEIAKKSLEHAGELARSLPQKEAALESMKDAISSNNLSYFSPDNLAELTGIDAFRSPEGAAFKTASKEFFLGNTLRVGAKGLNQWFEKQVLEMGPKIGRSTPANLAVTEMLDMEMDIQRKEIDLTNSIANDMENKYGYIKRDLPQKVQKAVSDYAFKRQKEAKKRIEDIKDRYQPTNKKGHLMRDPMGNLRRVSAKDFKAAKEAGYRVE